MVSIVIPIFNSAPYLSGCLASVSKQTIGDWEAILIDDASTDESAQIAASYCKQDQRFCLLQQPQGRSGELPVHGGQDCQRED